VLQAPPPAVARSPGFDYGTATEHATRSRRRLVIVTLDGKFLRCQW